jgi:hypothetical protein
MARVALYCCLLAALVACGGGDATTPTPPPPPPGPPPPPPPPPPPSPVATVVLSPDSTALVPQQTLQLDATLRDAGGAVLTGRPIVWNSDPQAVASVSQTGLVTALAPGQATVTATSEGRTGSAVVTVRDGGTVTAQGGVVVAAGGAVRIEVPPGAVAVPTVFTVAVRDDPLADPEGHWLVGGPVYRLGPEGAVFAQPVTVTLTWDEARIPPWAQAGALGLWRWDGAAWSPLADVVVDPVARTISGKTTAFSDVGPAIELPIFHVTPEDAQVNAIQRSVVLTAHTGDLPEDRWYHLIYEWTTTGQTGTVSWTRGNGAQYTATLPVLPPRGVPVDEVTVTVKARRWDGGPIETLDSRTVVITSDLKYVVEIAPWSSTVEFEETRDLEIVVRTDAGDFVDHRSADLWFTWDETGVAGNISAPLFAQSQEGVTTYTPKPTDQQQPSPPRGDKVTVIVEQRTRVSSGTTFNPNQFEFVFTELGRTEAFVEVGPNVWVGRFAVVTDPTPGGACVTAFVYAPKVDGATRYDLTATGFSAGGPWGTEFQKSWSGATGDGFLDVKDAGAEWRMALEGGCATDPGVIAFRQNLYATRYGGIKVRVKVTRPD